MNADTLATMLASYRFTVCSEAELGAAVEQAMRIERVSFVREVVLAKSDRIDFLCDGGIGIELKTRGSASEILRQLQRYASSDAITELILLTSRVQHAALLGTQRTVGGKPLRIVRVAGGFL